MVRVEWISGRPFNSGTDEEIDRTILVLRSEYECHVSQRKDFEFFEIAQWMENQGIHYDLKPDDDPIKTPMDDLYADLTQDQYVVYKFRFL